MQTKDGNQIYLFTRLTSRKGKDLLLSRDGQWCEVAREIGDVIYYTRPRMRYVGDIGVYRSAGTKWVQEKETLLLSVPKEFVEDKRMVR
jgi:hypothetical protein